MIKQEILSNILYQLRRKREKLNYTQAYVGTRIGYGQNAYSKIEMGVTELRLGVFLDLCQLLKLDVLEVIERAL